VAILALRLPLVDLGMGAASPRALLGGLALGPLAALLSLAAGMLFIIFIGPPPPDQPVERAIATIYDQTGWIGLLLITALLPGVVEEALFRGVILSGLRRRLPPGAAVLVCALAFALMHLSPWRFAPQLALGCLLGWLTLRTGSCWPAALAHAAHNGLVILVARLAHVPSA
jgi:sodium transport system permease protein